VRDGLNFMTAEQHWCHGPCDYYGYIDTPKPFTRCPDCDGTGLAPKEEWGLCQDCGKYPATLALIDGSNRIGTRIFSCEGCWLSDHIESRKKRIPEMQAELSEFETKLAAFKLDHS